MQKSKNYGEHRREEVIAIVFACVFLFGHYIFGQTGRGAMLSFICMSLAFLVADIYVIYLLVTGIKKKLVKTVSSTSLMMLAVVLILSWIVSSQTVDVIKDIQQGTQTGILTECSVQTTSGPKGLINRHYYLIGYDENGDKQRFEISGKDADKLRNRTQVGIEYYSNIERIYQYY